MKFCPPKSKRVKQESSAPSDNHRPCPSAAHVRRKRGTTSTTFAGSNNLRESRGTQATPQRCPLNSVQVEPSAETPQARVRTTAGGDRALAHTRVPSDHSPGPARGRRDSHGRRDESQYERSAGPRLCTARPHARAHGRVAAQAVNFFSTITNRGMVRFMVLTGPLSAQMLIYFLGRLIRDAERQAFLILDNLNVHNAA
jgi:hypothetical protein